MGFDDIVGLFDFNGLFEYFVLYDVDDFFIFMYFVDFCVLGDGMYGFFRFEVWIDFVVLFGMGCLFGYKGVDVWFTFNSRGWVFRMFLIIILGWYFDILDI